MKSGFRPNSSTLQESFKTIQSQVEMNEDISETETGEREAASSPAPCSSPTRHSDDRFSWR